MKKILVGFVIGFLVSSIVIVNLLQRIHVQIEKRGDIAWCLVMDEAVVELFGEPAREFFYVTFKIFKFDFKHFYIYRNFKNEIKFY